MPIQLLIINFVHAIALVALLWSFQGLWGELAALLIIAVVAKSSPWKTLDQRVEGITSGSLD